MRIGVLYGGDVPPQKRYGEMLSYQPPAITSLSLEKTIRGLKLVEAGDEIVEIAGDMGGSFGR